MGGFTVYSRRTLSQALSLRLCTSLNSQSSSCRAVAVRVRSRASRPELAKPLAAVKPSQPRPESRRTCCERLSATLSAAVRKSSM
jgi:hypothetical protein